MSFIEEEFFTASRSAVLYSLSSVNLYRAYGADLARYLQGRVTQDIRTLTIGRGATSLVLTPQGKIQGLFVLLQTEEGLMLLTDPIADSGVKDGMVAALLQFKVADDVAIDNITSKYTLFSLQGAKPESILRDAGIGSLPTERLSSVQTTLHSLPVLIVNHPRGPFPGYDLIFGPNPDIKGLSKLLVHEPFDNLVLGNGSALELMRIMAGRPQFGRDLSEKIAGPDIDLTHFIAPHKGCYAGQEVVEMSTARGRPNRKLLRFKSAKALQPGTVIREIKPGDDDGKPCGEITSAIAMPSKGYHVALGFIRYGIDEHAAGLATEHGKLIPYPLGDA